MNRDLVVVGLGYVGLPLAVEAARAGLTVAGLDVDSRVVAGLNQRQSHVGDIEDEAISRLVDGGFQATMSEGVLGAADTVVVCVPTPLSEGGGPDLRAVTSAMSAVGRNLRPGTLVVLESTTFPGTTEELVAPMLEEFSGLTVGRDYCLAYSPERIDPGNSTYCLRNTPKIVSGVTPDCARRAVEFYGRFIDEVVVATGTREAETAKLLENTYRHVNIALLNEMARFCHELDIDIWDVIRLAATKPFGFEAFYPGPGVGGHCIPIDPNYLSHKVRSALGYPFRFVELAQEINATMPAYVARRAQDILNADGMAINGAEVLLLGVTYKANVADRRETPAAPLARELQTLGALVSFHDPLVRAWPEVAGARPICDLEAAVSAADLVVLVQPHDDYDVDGLADRSQRFFDTRGVSRSKNAVRL